MFNRNAGMFRTGLILGIISFHAPWVTGQEAAPATPTTKPVPVSADLKLNTNMLDMDHLRANRMGFMPAGVKLITEKPSTIIKEPAYSGNVMYGVFKVGNGPKNLTYFVIDEPKDAEGKIYVDLNQNGDLSDDGPGKWDLHKEIDYRATVNVHASWGSPLREDEGGIYGLYIYKKHGQASVGYTKTTGREGSVTLGDKTYNIFLAENTNDGIFTVPAKDDRTRRPVEVGIDIDGDGLFKGFEKTIDEKKYVLPERHLLWEPFEIDGQWWIARPSLSGANLQFTKTSLPSAVSASAVPPSGRIILPIGSPAPDFTANGVDGKPVKLSDFKDKIVILDFWATWCGPCQIAMPGLQKIYDGVKDQGVVVLSLNVYDEKDAFDEWIVKHNNKDYTFTFAFDPAERDSTKSIAAKLFGVSPLPSMYVIDRQGKIAKSFIGTGHDEDLKQVLNELGVKAKAE